MIRLMQSADIARVYQIEAAVQSHPWTEKQFREAQENYQCTVIEKFGQVVGFCILQPVLDEANFYTKGVLAIAFENPKIEPEGIIAMWMVINKSSFQDEKVASAKPNFGN
mgnify:CR=1 FL=1